MAFISAKMSALKKEHRNPTQHIRRCDCVLFVVFYKVIGSMATTGCSGGARLQVILLVWVTISIFAVLLYNPIFVGVFLCPLGHENKEVPRKYGEENCGSPVGRGVSVWSSRSCTRGRGIQQLRESRPLLVSESDSSLEMDMSLLSSLF